MKHSLIYPAILCLIIVLMFSPQAWAQDNGYADTLRLGTVAATVENAVAVPVYLYNDEMIADMVIPLLVDGYSGWVRFDSVSYLDSRLADPSVLDMRLVTVIDSATCRAIMMAMQFGVSAGSGLAPGEGKLCDLWFTPLFGGDVAIDSLPDSMANSPYGSLLFATPTAETFVPEFVPGAINIACDYLVGDCREDEVVNVADFMGLQKGYHGCLYEDGGPFYVADVTCDRHVDMRDAWTLYASVFYGGSICECGQYSPGLYDDPGVPDTVWIESDTLKIGVESTIEIGIINDEPVALFALGLEWSGTANLVTPGLEFENVTERVGDLNLTSYNCMSYDGVNPDTLYMFTFGPGASMSAGSGAICSVSFTPTSDGTVSFRLVKFLKGSESMLVTESGAAILPVLAGGELVVAPRPCGDANNDGFINVGDVVFLINFVFKQGIAPEPECYGDANNDGVVNVGDAVYLIGYIFKQGVGPGSDCCEF